MIPALSSSAALHSFSLRVNSSVLRFFWRAYRGRAARSVFLFFAAGFACHLYAQTPAGQPESTQPAIGAAQAAPAPTEALRPVLDRIKTATSAINVARWKAPGEVRGAMQKNIDSIQQDIGATLPPLLDRANTPPVSLASAFAVYRNIDALYDVLLRVSETAALSAPQGDAIALRANLASLESARRDLGDAMLQMAVSQEQELAAFRTAAAAQAAAAKAAAEAAAAKAAAPARTVVEDGPAPGAKPSKRKKKQTPPPAAGTSPQ